MNIVILDSERSLYHYLESSTPKQQFPKKRISLVGDLESLIQLLARDMASYLVYNMKSKIASPKTLHNLVISMQKSTALCLLSEKKPPKDESAQTEGLTCFQEMQSLLAYLNQRPLWTPYSNLKTTEISINGQSARATLTEVKIFNFLASNSSAFITRKEIEEHVWGENVAIARNTLGTHLSNMKRKLPEFKRRLIACRTRGYQLS